MNLTSRHYFECESFSFNHEHLKNLMLWCYMCIFIKKNFSLFLQHLNHFFYDVKCLFMPFSRCYKNDFV